MSAVLQFIAVAGLGLSSAGLVVAQADTLSTVPIAEPAVYQDLSTWVNAVHRGNYRQFGFRTLNEVLDLRSLAQYDPEKTNISGWRKDSTVVFGAPIREWVIDLNSLRAYDESIDVRSVMTDEQHYTYPIESSGAFRTSFTVFKNSDDTLEGISFGSKNFYGAVSSARQQLAAETQTDESRMFLVRVPSLHVVFIGRQSGGTIFLTPVFTDRRFNFEAGLELEGSNALDRMVVEAIARDDEPH